tara:strand:+ start:3857 stop:4594 length:738 start_codon:yes stop_codon:yes gene_type:complete
MKKKFAVCFSGYPRFVRTTFDKIKENFLDGLGEYDIYANLQWDSKNWQQMEIHHEHSDKFENNELEDFKNLYSDLNLKKLQVNEPFEFDVSYYNKLSAEPDMRLSLEKSRDILYRFKSQYQGIADCIKLIDNVEDYDYIVRMRTDLVFETLIEMKDLETDKILNQNGHVAGWDRHYSDWFFIVPTKSIGFVDDLAKVESHFGNGIVHMHKMIEDVAKPYGIEHEELYVGTPSTSKMFGELLKERK